MKAFWYSSGRIHDLAIYARLTLAFEDVVVPDNDAKGYFPHSELNACKLAYFGPIPSAKFRANYMNSSFVGDWIDLTCFGDYLQAASDNDGVLVGTESLPDQELLRQVYTPSDEIPVDKKVRLTQSLLSLAGIEIALPNVNPLNVEILLEAKEKYAEEVADYQSYLAELLGGVWDVLKTDPTYDQLISWTKFIAATKIAPSLRRVHSAIRSGDRTLLERIGYSLGTEVPTLVSSQLKADHISLVSGLLSSGLDILAPNLAQSIRERRTLESAFGLAYLYKLRQTNERKATR